MGYDLHESELLDVVMKRIKKLEESGIIKRFTSIMGP